MKPTIKTITNVKKGSKNHFFNKKYAFWKIILESVYCDNLEVLILF